MQIYMGPWTVDDCHQALCIIIGIIMWRACPETSPCPEVSFPFPIPSFEIIAFYSKTIFKNNFSRALKLNPF